MESFGKELDHLIQDSRHKESGRGKDQGRRQYRLLAQRILLPSCQGMEITTFQTEEQWTIQNK